MSKPIFSYPPKQFQDIVHERVEVIAEQIKAGTYDYGARIATERCQISYPKHLGNILMFRIGDTPLMAACVMNSFPIIHMLLASPLTDVNAKNDYQETAAMTAMRWGSGFWDHQAIDLLEELRDACVRNGTTLDINSENDRGETLLALACSRNTAQLPLHCMSIGATHTRELPKAYDCSYERYKAELRWRMTQSIQPRQTVIALLCDLQFGKRTSKKLPADIIRGILSALANDIPYPSNYYNKITAADHIIAKLESKRLRVLN